MIDEKKGFRPEIGMVFDKIWFICGYCNELMAERPKVFGDIKFCPDRCPHCGTKVNRGESD